MSSETVGSGRHGASAADVLMAAGRGLSVRRVRVALTSLGIAIGIASMVSVVGISASAGADLDAALTRMGTDLLTVSAGRTPFGDPAVLPREAPAMIARIGPVTAVTATALVPRVQIYRSDRIPISRGGGIAVLAAQLNLLDTIGGGIAAGTWLNDATARYPTVVLGADAANTLGLTTVDDQVQVWLGRRWFSVVGILRPIPLAPELNNAALIGWPVAEASFGFDGHPTRIYERSDPAAVDEVRAVLAQTADPAKPSGVAVSRPSDALVAQRAVKQAFTALLAGIGAVALVVGALGITNTMVVSVLERRSEIGLRRALGATRRLIFAQFVTEALLLAGLGGLVGVVGGALATAGYATHRGWTVALSPSLLGTALLAATVLGAVAGAWPATRAARVSPTQALRSQ